MRRMVDKKIIRVFPRRTNATPNDENVRVGVVPGMYDTADQVDISVAFTCDKPYAEELAYQWETVAPVKIGGPAYGDKGGEFEPGKYLKMGYVITSRGCPNKCWFCMAWKNEGNTVRELEIKDGYNVLDNNLLACSAIHQLRVFEMLQRQKMAPRFTGGLEAARFNAWHAGWMQALKPEIIYFAYDTPDDYQPLIQAAQLCKCFNLFTSHNPIRCYVLIGYSGDTIEAAEKRLNAVVSLGIMPMAMLYEMGKYQKNILLWKTFQREWVRPAIVGSKMSRCKNFEIERRAANG